jgi:putative intracellular protease/amidase
VPNVSHVSSAYLVHCMHVRHCKLDITIANMNGGIDVRPDGVWDDFHIVDGRIVTGTNPQSAKSTAAAVLEVFNSL